MRRFKVDKVKSGEAYLKGRDTLKGVFLLVDSRVGSTEKDLQMKDWLDFYGIPYIVVATKVDKLKTSERQRLEKKIQEGFGDKNLQIVPFSAKTREGRVKLLREIERLVES